MWAIKRMLTRNNKNNELNLNNIPIVFVWIKFYKIGPDYLLITKNVNINQILKWGK